MTGTGTGTGGWGATARHKPVSPPDQTPSTDLSQSPSSKGFKIDIHCIVLSPVTAHRKQPQQRMRKLQNPLKGFGHAVQALCYRVLSYLRSQPVGFQGFCSAGLLLVEQCRHDWSGEAYKKPSQPLDAAILLVEASSEAKQQVAAWGMYADLQAVEGLYNFLNAAGKPSPILSWYTCLDQS